MTTITFQDLKDVAPWCSIAVAIAAVLIALSARSVAARALSGSFGKTNPFIPQLN